MRVACLSNRPDRDNLFGGWVGVGAVAGRYRRRGRPLPGSDVEGPVHLEDALNVQGLLSHG